MCYIHMESSKEFEGGNHTDCCERARLNRYSRESSSNDQRLWWANTPVINFFFSLSCGLPSGVVIHILSETSTDVSALDKRLLTTELAGTNSVIVLCLIKNV